MTKPARETRIWTLVEMHEFAVAAGPRNEAMIRMLSDCGMRVGEMLALRRSLQDLKTGIFRVRGHSLERRRDRKLAREESQPHWADPAEHPGAVAGDTDVDRCRLAVSDARQLAHRRLRIEWPSHEELLAELETMSYTALSRKLGASDNALRNPMRAYEAGLQPGVAAIAGHLMNVQAEHYRQALHRSSDFIRAAIG